jgi:hypothetical protein
MSEEPANKEPSMGEKTQPPDLARALTALRVVLVGFLRFSFLVRRMRWRSRYFLRLSVLCHLNCLFEVWAQIADGASLDSESQLYKDADAAITYYLMRSSTSRESFAPF